MLSSGIKIDNPRVFISYSWDSGEHRLWVQRFAEELREAGIDARLDKWRDPDQSIDDFMMVELERASYVIAICTPEFKQKILDHAEGTKSSGSGVEMGTAAALLRFDKKAIVPVLARGEMEDSTPSTLRQFHSYDFTQGDRRKTFISLKEHLLGQTDSPPPLGIVTPPEQRPELPDIFAPTAPNERVTSYERSGETREISAKDKNDLTILLSRVASIWTTADENTLAELRIGAELRRDAISQPFEGLSVSSEEAPKVLSPDESILDIFERERSLVILGHPGSGKTTTLLELAHHLVERAEKDIGTGVPVILHLSSFTDANQSFESWLVEELLQRYSVPKPIGAAWIEQQRLIFLFDGLDETLSQYRMKCVDAIHRFLENQYEPRMCVCCRTQEYEELDTKLRVRGAIYLHPLTEQQVSEYIDARGAELAVVGELLRRHKPLRDLAKSPLMLQLMCHSYSGMAIESLQGSGFDTLDACRKHLFDTYVEKMFKNSGNDAPYERKKTMSSLHWLAHKGTAETGSAIFQIEALQPSWMSRPAHRIGYSFFMALVMAIICTAVTTVFWYSASTVSADTKAGVSEYPLSAALVFFAWHFLASLLERQLPNADRYMSASVWQKTVQAATKVVVFFLIWGSVLLLVERLTGIGEDTRRILIATGALASLLYGAYGRACYSFSDIPPVETVSFDWSGARTGAIRGVLAGLTLWVTYRLVWGEEPDIHFWFRQTSSGRDGFEFYLLGFAFAFAVVGTIFGGRVPRMAEDNVKPNQGIRLSIRNGATSGAIVGVVMFIVGVASYATLNPELGRLASPENPITWAVALTFALGAALAGFYSAAFWFGWFSAVKHFALRSALTVFGYLPINVSRFMDHAIKLGFIRRRGGAYMFMHRLMLDYFAKDRVTKAETTGA